MRLPSRADPRRGYTRAMATLLLFIDGIGVGGSDAERNPFAAPGIERLAVLAGRPPRDGAAFRPLDATLGVPGLPQSATGQTTLFTGVNAAQAVGEHRPGLPGPSLRTILREHSLFAKLAAAGARPTFANAFSRRYLASPRPRFGATTHMVLASPVALRLVDDGAGADGALSHDYAGDWMGARGVPVPRRTAAEAATLLARWTSEHDLVLYEYFLTDLVAHRGTTVERFDQARRVEALVAAALDAIDLDRHRVVVVSDHGNLEEADHRRHTLNPAPILAWGRGADAFVERVSGMDQLTPALVEEAAARGREAGGLGERAEVR